MKELNLDNLTVWDKKFLRDQPFMPFGSMMNAYGLVNKGKEKTITEFLLDVDMIFQKAQEITKKSFETTYEKNRSKQLDFKGRKTNENR